MKRILFVDDEPHVLSGLADMLRRERKQWDMVFASGATAAIAEFEKEPFDVVVSDMRMPGIDGAELLQLVRAKYPSAARLILSGQCDRAAILRALPVAQQFLSKPVDSTVIRASIARILSLRERLEDEGVRRIVGHLDRLPSFPDTYWNLTRVMGDESASIKDVARVVERDPALSAKLLQLANSAYFGSARAVTSIQGAVSYLGVEILRSLTLSAHVFASIESSPRVSELLGGLQKRSFDTAQLSKLVVEDPRRAEDAFTAALVHDVGMIVLAANFPDEVAQSIARAHSTGRSFVAVEEEQFGASHTDLGAYLLGLWGLPFSIVETVAHHHEPRRVQEGPVDVLAAVHLMSVLSAMDPKDLDVAPEGLDLEFVERAGLKGSYADWTELVRARPWETARSGSR